MEEKYLRKKDNESLLDYYKRITLNKKEYDIDYVEWGNAILGKDNNYSSENLRKAFYVLEKLFKQLDLNEIGKIPETQLSSIKEKIGELSIIKRQTQVEKNELNKIKRDFIRTISITEELEKYLEEHDFQVNVPEYCNHPINEDGTYTMIVHITDWHIGYVINDCKGNYFNWKIANKRIDELINECYKYIELYNIKKVYVINTGDIIEQTYMRKTQSQFCEFYQSEQINKAIEIIYRFLIALEKYCDVEYDSIYGNHDRMNGDKTANLDGDNAEVIIREQIGRYKTISKNGRLTVIPRKHTDKEIKKEINGIKCKFMHGENKINDGKQLMKNEISMDNEFYNLIFKGHLHNFKIESENNGRYVISTGCLSGYNDYSVNFACTSVASQTICILGNRKVELIKDIQLN